MCTTPISLRSFLHQNAWQVTTIFVLFILATTAIYSFFPTGSYLARDTVGYIEPAKKLVEEGVYSSVMRLPGYPVFIATIMHFTDSIWVSVVVAQSVMLFAVAIMTALFSERVRPDSGMPALTLVCFNPSTLYYAQKILPDMLFVFLFMIYFYSLIQTYRQGSIYSAILLGVAVGLMAILRGNGQYLLFFMPIIFVFGYRLANIHWPGVRQIHVMLVAVVAAMSIVGPWLYINEKEQNGFSLISNAYRNYVLHDNMISAVSLSKSIAIDQAADAVYASCMQREGIELEEWELLDWLDKHKIVAKNSWQIITMDLSLQELTFALSKALIKFFITAEGRGWSLKLQQDPAEILKGADEYRFSLAAILQSDPAVSTATKYLHFLTITFNLLIYSLCLVGLFYLVRVKAWDIILSISICIFIIAGTAGFIGYARYRLPLDPLLICLASIGVPGILHWLRSLRVGTS